MAGRSLPVGNRSRTSLDQEKENFDKNQTIAISKAISEIEVPVKAKHVRSAIIGTFQEKSSSTFWSIVFRLPVHGNPIVAWKFCHTLHKLLREGHQNVLKDSYKHRDFLVDNGKLWGHLKEGYGKLIYLYCRILVVKLDFHRRNQNFPGNLLITDQDLEVACENDVNLYFQLSVELLDYMDEILNLQSAVFGSLDMSRSNSMTNAGQCRLAPLIPCIQDSSQIYDYIVKLLFKLHSCLPPDTLEGHRLRFLKQFKSLRQFYLQSSTLQYFKTLIQVPYLDENPPNFLVSSELSRHVTPVVILPPEPPAPDVSLVELGDPDSSERNGSSSPDLLAERDRYIQELLYQIEQLSSELKRIRAGFQRQNEEMQHSLKEFQLRLAEKDTDIEDALRGKEEIERKLAEAAQSAQLGSVVQLQLQEVEKKAKGWEEKFVKLKEVYQKLRDEHIALIRQKADADKKLSVAEAAAKDSAKIYAELHDALELSKASAKDSDAQLDSVKKVHDENIKELSRENQELRESKDSLKALLADAEQRLEEMSSEIRSTLQEKERLLILADGNKATLLDSERKLAELQNSLDQSFSDVQKSSQDFVSYKAETEVKMLNLIKEMEEVSLSRSDLQAKVQELECGAQGMASSLTSLQQEKADLIAQLNNLRDAIELSESNAQNWQESLEEMKSKFNDKVEELNACNKIALALEEEKEQLTLNSTQLQEKASSLEYNLAKAIDERNAVCEAKDLVELKIKEEEEKHKQELNSNKLECMRLLQRLLVDCAVKAEQYLEGRVADLSKSPVVAITIIEHNWVSAQGTLSQLELLSQALDSFLNQQSDENISRIIPLIFPLAQSVGHSLLQGQQLAHSLPDLVAADQLLAKCILTGKAAVDLDRVLQKPLNAGDIRNIFDKVRILLQDIDSLAEAAVEKMKAAADRENVVDLENELGAMERAIEEAADRIAKMWDNSKRSQTGLKLEVNEKVLDSCTALMKAIIELIKNAKILQEEIVSRGKGSATAKEFYKRNHRWSEGLLSAAKAVGFGAKLLTDAADKVVQGHAKFEQLTVASQEIAASTAQLVFASRVKAELQSKNLQSLAEASKAVSSATGGVVATAKLCAQLVEDSTVLDFSNLTLHQAKRLEMESQVKVLEFESSLEKERLKLSALRRQHYQLAGEMES